MTPTSSIERFVTLAQEFCRWCDEPASSKADALSLAREMRLLLARLIAGALELPESNPGDRPAVEHVDDAALKALCHRLAQFAFDFYRVYFQPSELDSEPVVGSLTDDLQDIYRDLRAGLWLYERGHVHAAVWEWSLHFDIHWGHHASNALHALQAHATCA